MLYGAIEYIDCLMFARVAHRLEQNSYKVCVEGSTPSMGTDQANWIASSSQVIRLVLALVAQQTEQVSPKDKVAGAIPVKGTAKEVYPTSLLPRLPLLFSQMV